MISTDELASLDRSAVRVNGYGGVDAALAMHDELVRIYEQGYNTHTFDFEKDIGLFMAADVTVVSDGSVGGRSLLAESSEARADYVCGSGATVTIDSKVTSVSDLGATVVLVVEAELTFTYPDQTTFTQRLLASPVLRFLNDRWVYQHIHLGRSC